MIIRSIFIMLTISINGLLASNLESTVYDNETGLIWQDDSDSKTVKRDLYGAKDYCYGLTIGGYRDWRLPELYELESIIEKNNSRTIKVYFKNAAVDYYWSATRNPYSDWYGVIVSFQNGTTVQEDEMEKNHVRCVRNYRNVLKP